MDAIDSFDVLANLARFADMYRVEDIRTATVARMTELVDIETDYEMLCKLSTIASKFNLAWMKLSPTRRSRRSSRRSSVLCDR